ncbi:MAG: TetR/AcrR family transcriptional regulator [Zavarzinia sp.]|nr:TetR/AcrR family transcriptional regulator [Zavarzinia sp.]
MSPTDQASPATPRPRGRPRIHPEAEKRVTRTQAERSEDMRRRIIDAAAKVMGAHGYAGFRTAEVSRVAGVSRGAQLHHFPTKDQLVVATLRHVYGQALERSRVRAGKIDLKSDIIDQLIDDARDFFFSRHFLVSIDIVVSAATDPGVRDEVLEIARTARLPVEQAWSKALVENGIPEKIIPGLLSIVMGVVRGQALRKLWDDDSRKDKVQFAMLRDMVRTYVAAQEDRPAAPVPKSRKRKT